LAAPADCSALALACAAAAVFIVVFDAHDGGDDGRVYKLVNFACKEDFEEKGGSAERLGYISRSSACRVTRPH